MGSRTARVIVASTRASQGIYADLTGPKLVNFLISQGFTTAGPRVVADGPPVEEELRIALAEYVNLILTTGGTGISPTDRTPEATLAVIDYEVPGIAELLRQVGQPHVPTAALSRGVAGVAGTTLIINIAGSMGAVSDAIVALTPILVPAVGYLEESAIDPQAGCGHRGP